MMSAAGSCTTIDELSSATIEDTAQSAARQQSLPQSGVPLHLTTYKWPADNYRPPAASYRSQTSQASHRTVRTGALAGISVITESASSPAADEARAAAAAEGLELLPSSSNDTGFKGVFNKGAKYATQIWENGKMRLLGTFATPGRRPCATQGTSGRRQPIRLCQLLPPSSPPRKVNQCFPTTWAPRRPQPFSLRSRWRLPRSQRPPPPLM